MVLHTVLPLAPFPPKVLGSQSSSVPLQKQLSIKPSPKYQQQTPASSKNKDKCTLVSDTLTSSTQSYSASVIFLFLDMKCSRNVALSDSKEFRKVQQSQHLFNCNHPLPRFIHWESQVSSCTLRGGHSWKKRPRISPFVSRSTPDSKSSAVVPE